MRTSKMRSKRLGANEDVAGEKYEVVHVSPKTVGYELAWFVLPNEFSIE